MERNYNEDYYILKNPTFISDIETIFKDTSIIIKTIIIPIRDLKISSKSRVKHKYNAGGLWNANNELSQLLYYKKILANYLYFMTKYDINTIFINFDKMITDKKYLFNKIKSILDEKNINFDIFCNIYDEVSLISKS